MLAIQRLRGAEVHRDAMLHDLILVEDLVEDLERVAAADHVVFGDDLKPVDDRLFARDVVVVRHAQADADTVFRKRVESVCWHCEIRSSQWREEEVGGLSLSQASNTRRLCLRGLEPSVAQAPLPLQLFLPACFASPPPWPLQSFLPLQECLGSVGAVLRDQQETGTGGRRAVLTSGLGVEAGGCPAKKPGECGREGQVVYGIAFHEEHLSWLGRAVPRAGRDGCGGLQLRISRESFTGRASGSRSNLFHP